MTTETGTDVIRWYNADGVDLVALAKLLEPYQAYATISAVGGCRVMISHCDADAADQCEAEMRRHWSLCIRKLATEGKVIP